jgi:hypothetical protein
MRFTIPKAYAASALMLAAMLLVACSDDVTTGLTRGAPQHSTSNDDANVALATLERVTAKYHRLDAAVADSFTLLHPCEQRGDEGPVGIVYVNFARLLDGVIDPELPDALIYEPSKIGQPTLVGVEFAIPYSMWNDATPPQFLGATFQPEDEFGVFALHAWVWRRNPNGMFAETNPRVSCDAA